MTFGKLQDFFSLFGVKLVISLQDCTFSNLSGHTHEYMPPKHAIFYSILSRNENTRFEAAQWNGFIF
jgi:hypothetical protein